MAKTKQVEAVKATEEVKGVPLYKGSQLLKLDKYNNRVARIVIDKDKYYSFAEVDETIIKYMNKKG